MVAVGEEKHEVRITTNGEDPIDGKGSAAEGVSRVDDRDLARDAIND